VPECECEPLPLFPVEQFDPADWRYTTASPPALDTNPACALALSLQSSLVNLRRSSNYPPGNPGPRSRFYCANRVWMQVCD
ncbi:hypothetical protein PENTCL1PPCAC_3456, partial [Pristionchus entomophagus]